MKYVFIEIANVFLEIMIISIYLKGLFQNYEKKTIFIYLYYSVAAIGLCILSNFLDNPLYRLGFAFLIIFLIAKRLFNTKWITAFYSALLFCAISVIVDIVCSGIISLFGLPTASLMIYGNNRILFIVFAKLIESFCIFLAIKLSKWKKSQDSLIAAIPLLLCQISSIFVCYIMYLAAVKTAEDVSFSFIAGAVGILYINIVIFLYVERIKEVSEIKRQNEMAELQYKSKLEYFEQIKEDQDETRALWHDIKKYLLTINELMSRNDITRAKECINQVTDFFENIGNVVDVGNTVVSAVLNHSIQKARRMSIDTELDVRIQPDLNISAADLSVIIGNTFDNAIEACGMLSDENKKISVQLIQKNNILFYEIKNPYAQITAPVKKDRKMHGFGLRNVKRCIEKYKGSFIIDSVDSEFKVSIHINIPSQAAYVNLANHKDKTVV